jgi:hypothetical protein
VTFGALAFAAVVAVSPSPSPVPVPVPSPVVHTVYAELTAGAKRQSGLFDVLTKGENIYFDLAPKDLNTTFVIEAGIAKGVGPVAFTGRALDSLPIAFVRQGNRIFWEVPNDNYIHPTDPAAALDLGESISDSVIGVSPILAEDAATKHILIAPTLLTGDFEHLAEMLNPHPSSPLPVLVAPAAGGYAFSPLQTYPLGIKAFPTNIELLMNLGFTAPAAAPPSIADPRGFRVVMHYSFVALPNHSGYQTRPADDRVGYFVDTLKNLNDTNARSPYVRYIMRWDMRHKPIVFYLTNEIPPQYRASVRRGILAWNAAFERVGMRDAIEVRDQPSDPSFDPDDARYSTVRWITSDQPSFGAYTGFFSDPFTGEIFRAEVVIDGENLRGVRDGYQDDVRPILNLDADNDARATEQTTFSRLAASVLGRPIDSNAFVQQYIQAVVMHEVGHAFGLRHNFEASTLYSLAQLHDPAFTAKHGLAASVMDYLPINISPPHVRQGAYFQLMLGPYDYWAIRYGYETGVDPRTIANQSGRPEYRYGTDDETTLFGLDPRISSFDLSSDPLGFDAEQFALTRAIVQHLDARFAHSGGSYYDERIAFISALQNYALSASLATRYIGGEYTSRTHRGEAGGQPPFTAIPRATSRRAFELLARNVFAPDAFTLPPSLVRDLGQDYFHGWGATFFTRPDFPALAYSNSVQDSVLNQLFSIVNVARIYDVETTSNDVHAAIRLEDLFEWTRVAAFAELPVRANAASEAHRELQRHYVDLMIAFQTYPSAFAEAAGLPRESQALARYELEEIDRTVTQALHLGTLDVTTRAHLEDLQARVNRALHGVNIVST